VYPPVPPEAVAVIVGVVVAVPVPTCVAVAEPPLRETLRAGTLNVNEMETVPALAVEDALSVTTHCQTAE
jgi:hypothetical protein